MVLKIRKKDILLLQQFIFSIQYQAILLVVHIPLEPFHPVQLLYFEVRVENLHVKLKEIKKKKIIL